MNRPQERASVYAVTAMSAAGFSEPYLRVTIEERDARHFKPGSYLEHGGRIRKVVRIERPRDWFDLKVTLVLEDGNHEARDYWEGGAFMTLLSKLPSQWRGNSVIRWLEDEAPRLTR